MKIDISADLRSSDRKRKFLTHFILNLVKWDRTSPPDPKSIDLAVTINGREVDALAFVQSIEDQMDHMVQQRVKILLAEKFDHFGRLHDILFDVEKGLKAAVRDKLPEANWGKYGDDWEA